MELRADPAVFQGDVMWCDSGRQASPAVSCKAFSDSAKWVGTETHLAYVRPQHNADGFLNSRNPVLGEGRGRAPPLLLSKGVDLATESRLTSSRWGLNESMHPATSHCPAYLSLLAQSFVLSQSHGDHSSSKVCILKWAHWVSSETSLGLHTLIIRVTVGYIGEEKRNGLCVFSLTLKLCLPYLKSHAYISKKLCYLLGAGPAPIFHEKRAFLWLLLPYLLWSQPPLSILNFLFAFWEKQQTACSESMSFPPLSF